MSLCLVLVLGLELGAIDAPRIVAQRTGDLCVTLHWSGRNDSGLYGYRVYRSSARTGPFTMQAALPATSPRWCDFNVENGLTYFYRIRALSSGAQEESEPSEVVAATPRPFASDDEFLDFLQQAHFDYFWFGANAANGLVPDRSAPGSPCSIAAVGFGLSAIAIGIDHGWITRAQGAERVLTTLKTFWSLPQGPGVSEAIGFNGWFYHFLDMNSGLRFTRFNTELSSIDTALLLAGSLDVRQFFDGDDVAEVEVRRLAESIFNRVDWAWMARDSDVLSMGWKPDAGFLGSTWVGYNEAMILYLMAMGASSNALPASAWARWTSGYSWRTNFGHAYVQFSPLFGHQYSHCWVDFRRTADPYMRGHGITYFENSRRATLAQRAYCIANPAGYKGYSRNVWGVTACDGPKGYSARGAPPPEHEDGTVAPTAAGSSIAFAPEVCIPALRHLYESFRPDIWTPFGFRDAFNQDASWWGPDTLGIDQGPIVIMIENYRTQRVWRRFMRNPQIQLGLKCAGFTFQQARKPFEQALVKMTSAEPSGGVPEPVGGYAKCSVGLHLYDE